MRYCRQAIVNLQMRHRFFFQIHTSTFSFHFFHLIILCAALSVCLSVCVCIFIVLLFNKSVLCVRRGDTQITIPQNFILSYHLKSKSNFAFISTNTISCHSKRFMMPHIHIVSELGCFFCEKEIAYYMKPNVDCQLLIANATQSEDQQFYQIMNVN